MAERHTQDVLSAANRIIRDRCGSPAAHRILRLFQTVARMPSSRASKLPAYNAASSNVSPPQNVE